ncbi:deoxyribodipyrimidine photo-lyase [Ramlibacter sp.]|uniref:cryptochrome/photolyase family protein n=1 Tax=Ramlibacter sp. TaxID=1917967 RepID=UPI0035B3D7B1
MTPSCDTGLVWLRRDLRLDDHAALYHALKACRGVHCVFVFDTDILAALPRRDRRVEFIHASLRELDAALRAQGEGRGLIVLHGSARDEIPRLASALGAQAVFANHDDEPFARQRDDEVRASLAGQGIALHTWKDHVVFERQEVLTQAGKPYAVFTPYSRAWRAKLDAFYLKPYPVARYLDRLAPVPEGWQAGVPPLAAIGFEPSNLGELPVVPGASGAQALLRDFASRMDRYADARDFPAIKGPSYLSVHLRFGTLSIRQAAALAQQAATGGSRGADVWLNELIWRDFYHQVLANFPHVHDAQGASHSFRPEYDGIAWEQGPEAEALFAAWCEGRTGYPLVDAAMAQINQTGYMHNRLRMVVASFLTKDLGIDWRRGEAYFAQQLIDFDLAANNGGWQWAASSGCDAQPYFRIFNPVSQSEKFDPEGRFIRRYLPQLAGLSGNAVHAPWTARPLDLQAAGLVLGRDYPLPVVDHAEAREQTLRRYAVVKAKG